jgi:hypothetical protein
MADLAPYIFQQYFEDDGTPLNAGTIDAYAAGTLNRKDTFTTAAGTTANANPFTLDADGRTTFYLESGSYDFVIKNSAGTTLDTKEDILGSSGTGTSSVQAVATIAELKALVSGSSSYVDVNGYYADGDNRVRRFYWSATSSAANNDGTVIIPDSAPGTGRWLDANLGELSVKDFGAKGLGVLADGDMAKCQTCLDLGRDVVFPTGTYILTDALTLSNSNQTIRGESYASILQPTVDGKNCFTATSQSNLQFNTLAITFSVTSQTTAVAQGIQLLNCYDCSIRRVRIEKAGSFAIDLRDMLAG